MKKRIITSAMASVMALSGAASALVASADVADFKTQAISKADLRKFMDDKEIKDLVEGGIDNYGSVSGENFQKAVDFANAVLDDAEATADDVTVAFQMVKAAKASLRQYTKEELQLLVAECKSKYETNNELNEDDAIYDEEDWADFTSAYETAYDAQESDDILETTDAYEELDDKKNPEELDKKTKNQIEKARLNYIKALEREYEYQPWQRGTITAAKTDYDGLQFAWGALYAHIASGKDAVLAAYEDFTEIKGRSVTSNPTIVAAVDAMEEAAKVLNGFDAKFDSASTKKSVTDLLAKYHGQLVYTYNQGVAIEVANSFVTVSQAATDKDGAAGVPKFTVENKSKAYASAVTFADGDAKKFWNVDESKDTEYKPLGDNGVISSSNSQKYTAKVKKVIGAEIEIESTAEVYYVVKTDEKLENNKNPIVDMATAPATGTYFGTKAVCDTFVNGKTGYEVKALKANSKFNISDLIKVTPDDVIKVLATKVDESLVTDSDVTTALDAVTGNAQGATSTALATFVTAISAASTQIDGLGTAATTAGNITAAQKEALQDAVKDLKDAADALVLVASTAATKTDIDKLETDLSGLKDLNDAVVDAIPTADTDGTALSASTWVDDIEGLTAAHDTTLTGAVTGTGKFSALKATYDAAYATAAATQVKTVSYSDRNMIFDKSGELEFKYDSGSPKSTDKGIVFLSSGSGTSDFDLSTDYATARSDRDNGVDDTTVSLGYAMQLYTAFILPTTNQTGAVGLDNTNTLSELSTGKNYPKAWRLLYNYMKYALEDEFEASASSTYKKKDIVSLKAKAEALLEKTVETELFSVSHNALVDNVNAASEWIKLANADKNKYKDCDSKYNVDAVSKGGSAATADYDSTGMYNKLNDTYKQLNNEFNGFAYSYDEIVKKMASIAKEIDEGKFSEDVAKKLTADLADAAEKFVKVEIVLKKSNAELDDSELFNDDGTMNKANRLYTYTSGDLDLYTAIGSSEKIAKSKKDSNNKTHYNMQVAYEKLLKDYTDATTAPEVKVEKDVNGDGDFTPADVSALLRLVVDDKGEVAKHDFSGDGKVDFTDVSTLLKAWVEEK